MNPLDFPNPKIAAYVRVSGIKQSETSLDTQLDEIPKFADSNGLVISDVYKDKVTASGKLERPNFSKMIDKALQGKYNLILVYKQDRFHRVCLSSRNSSKTNSSGFRLARTDN